MAFVFSDAQQFLRDYNREDTTSRADRVLTRIINDANRALHSAGDWDFDKKTYETTVDAMVTTGTVSVSAASSMVTGSGTAFASTDVGKYIRLNGEVNSYLVTARASTTSITISPAYRGTTSLTDVNYQLTMDRISVPSNFRSILSVQLDYVTTPMMSIPLEQIKYNKKFYKEVNYPRAYAIEWSTSIGSTTDRVPYLWIYPSAVQQQILELFYFAWPAETSSSSDVFGIPTQAEGILREFMIAYLLQEQRAPESGEAMAKAIRSAREGLAMFRSQPDVGQKEIWTPNSDDGVIRSNSLFYPLAPGEPRYV